MIIEEVQSNFSGKLQVLKIFPWEKPYISSGLLTQSGGLVHDVWKPVLPQIKKYQSFLILGLAGGTLANQIYKIKSQAQITGIEIDPQMIYLGKKYLYLDKVPGLKVIQADARKYIQTLHQVFDVVFVDMYYGDQIPDFVYSPRFLSRLSKLGKLIIINHLFYDEEKKNNTQALITRLESCGFDIKIIRVLTNVLIIATPKTHRQN